MHPKWYPEAQVICACGNTWTTGATVPVIRTDVCSACHPFFTGEQRIVDTAGQVDRFMKRLEQKQKIAAQQRIQQEVLERQREAAKLARRRGDDPEEAARRAAEEFEAQMREEGIATE
ncbi:MAG TPA: 50S ribosomal protein L31 [Anaerolineae bacterium]|nr:50S ribosomal protein L31 [Anaerolineae bacterium]